MLTGPERYDLTLTPTTYTLDRKFCGFARKKKIPKLYVVAAEGHVVYVGVTRQPMSNRLRYGFKAKGKGGYYGYAWRNKHTRVSLYLWAAQEDTEASVLETIEAEVVFLARHSTGAWPDCQTEIHFHKASEAHKQAATAVWKAIPKSRVNDSVVESRAIKSQ
jgi:hypothetical protein